MGVQELSKSGTGLRNRLGGSDLDPGAGHRIGRAFKKAVGRISSYFKQFFSLFSLIALGSLFFSFSYIFFSFIFFQT